MTNSADITVIGAGVVGLAVAAEVASEEREVYVLEKNETFGKETSSRNSEVIHSGIYYPKGSLKAKMCITGNHMLYELCNKYNINHQKTGKLIVASNNAEVGELQILLKRGQDNGIGDLQMLSQRELRKLEPMVECRAAILSSSTGIVDSHGLMRYFIGKAMNNGAHIVYRTNVVGIIRTDRGYRVTVEDNNGQSSFSTKVIVNCAGLYSDTIAEIAGIDIYKAGYKLYYCRGEYFSLSNKKGKIVNRLIYPLPPSNITGAGIHLTMNLEGKMRLGPSVQYVDSLDYSIDNRNKREFYDTAKKYLPWIKYDDLDPDMVGIRPKLQQPGGVVRDFVIRDESDRDLPGLINLIGIESPGLTASPAIAQHVCNMIKDVFS